MGANNSLMDAPRYGTTPQPTKQAPPGAYWTPGTAQLGSPYSGGYARAPFQPSTGGQTTGGGINPGQSNPAPTLPGNPALGMPGVSIAPVNPYPTQGGNSGGNPPLINPAAPTGANYGPFTPPSWWPTRNLNDPGFNPDPWGGSAGAPQASAMRGGKK